MRIKRKYEKVMLHPIITFCLLIFGTIILSGVLTLFNASATYSKVSNIGSYVSDSVYVENLFSLSGLKYIFTTTVKNFANFAVLTNLIIRFVNYL